MTVGVVTHGCDTHGCDTHGCDTHGACVCVQAVCGSGGGRSPPLRQTARRRRVCNRTHSTTPPRTAHTPLSHCVTLQQLHVTRVVVLTRLWQSITASCEVCHAE